MLCTLWLAYIAPKTATTFDLLESAVPFKRNRTSSFRRRRKKYGSDATPWNVARARFRGLLRHHVSKLPEGTTDLFARDEFYRKTSKGRILRGPKLRRGQVRTRALRTRRIRNLIRRMGLEPRYKKPKFRSNVANGSWKAKLEAYKAFCEKAGMPLMEPQGLREWAEKRYIESRSEDICAFIEGLTVLAGQICTSTNMQNVSLCLVGYALSHYKGSILMKARELITEFCRTPQGDDDEPDWLSTLKNVNSNWKQTVQNPAFAKISELLGMFVAMGILSTEHVDFEIAGVRLFAKNIHNQHLTATNLLDAVLSTVVFFAEGGYYAIKTRSLKPLMFGNRDILHFDEEFIYLSSLFSAAVAGNLVKMDTSFELFERRVERFIAKGNELVVILPGGFERKLIMDRLVTIKKEFSEFTQKRLEGGSREAPLMMSIFGRSAVGKSTFVDFIVPYLLKVNGFACTDDFITTLDPNSKHDTNWRSYMTAMKLDDWNNSKSDKTDVNPAQKIIDYCNNVRRYAEMADIERKGKVVIEPKIISITTNTRDLGAREFSNEPASIVRRPKLHIEISVKPEFRKEGSHELDTAKVEAFYKGSNAVVHDIWLVSVSYVLIKPGKDQRKKRAPQNLKKKPLFPLGIDRSAETEEETDNKFHVPDDFVWVPYHDEIGPMVDVDMKRLLPFLVKESRKHFQGQSFVTTCTQNVGDRLNICDECALPVEFCGCWDGPVTVCGRCSAPTTVCDCDLPELVTRDYSKQGYDEPTSFFTQVSALVQTQMMNFSWHSIFSMQKRWLKLEKKVFGGLVKWLSETFPVVGLCEEVTINKCYTLMKKFDENPWFKWTSYVPESMLEEPVFMKYAVRSRRDAVNQMFVFNVMLKLGLLCIATAFPTYFIYGKSRSALLAIFGLWWTYISVYQRKEVEKDVMRHIRESRDMMPSFIKAVREDYFKYTVNAFVCVAALYSVYRLYKRVKEISPAYETQSGITDPSEEDVQARDEKGEDKWWEPKYSAADFDALPRSKWTNHVELGNVVHNNLLHVTFQSEDGQNIRSCGGLMIKSNYLLVPSHMISTEVRQLTCVRKPHDGVCRNSSFVSKIDSSVIALVKDHDLVLIYLPNSGDFADVTSAFPPTMFKTEIPFTMAWRNKEGNIQDYRGLAAPCMVPMGKMMYRGCSYTLNEPTFGGLCMAVMIGQNKFPHIVGFHLGGVKGTKAGCGGTPLQGDILAVIKTLQESHPTHFASASMGEFPVEIYGVPTFQGAEVKNSSPLTRIQDTNCRVYGKCPGAVHSKSSVRTLPMSKRVEEVFGMPNLWGAPKMKGPDGKSSWWPWQTNLESSLKPSIGVTPELLKRAYDDYVETLTSILDRKPFWKKKIKPLSDDQTVNGIDNCKFIDRMSAKTSVGFPLSGAKSKFLTEIEHPDFEYATVLDPMFWKEAHRMEECYKQGRRAYAIFKASLKDEPTKLSKDKVRVFQAAPMALQLSIRKYFLPICRFLSCNPLDSECAVGINPHSPDWDELHRHVSSKGKNCMAIDYKKYDTRMPCQLVYAAFAVYIDIAKHSGNYTEDDLAIMRGVATEVANSMIAYNGELLCHVGTNPSGQNLTVYINSIVNSLLHRCGFFQMYPYVEESFSQVMALTTYGDDAKGTVDPNFPDFNMVTFRDFLASCDIQITMADKEAEFVEYGTVEGSDYLKRKSIFHEDLQLYLAALDIESIFKPMHIGLASIVPDEIIMADALDNGMREMLYHGKEAFEDFSSKASRVAEEQKIDHLMKLKGKSYEHMLYDWACDHGVEDRLPASKYAEVAAYKTKASTELSITDCLPIVPLQEDDTL